MLECKNDSTRNYKGNEPSPKGLGICAYAEKLNTKKKGKDCNMWIVTETKSGVKRWIKYIKDKKDRPYPVKSATLFSQGRKKERNDSNKYIVVMDKNGVKRMKKLSDKKKKKATKKSSKKRSQIKKGSKKLNLEYNLNTNI